MLAPSIDFSSNGDNKAFSVAFTALFSPSPSPNPSTATPEFIIVALISAKSRLISPLPIIRSATPLIPIFRILFASLNAFCKVIVLSGNSKSLSFGIITKASTAFLRFSTPISALFFLFFPSNENGLVTTATVNTPSSFATLAITGAAPVPVPPPIPAVMKSISVSSKRFLIFSTSSSAACLPISGSAPAPSPLVNFSPSWILMSARDLFKS